MTGSSEDYRPWLILGFMDSTTTSWSATVFRGKGVVGWDGGGGESGEK